MASAFVAIACDGLKRLLELTENRRVMKWSGVQS